MTEGLVCYEVVVDCVENAAHYVAEDEDPIYYFKDDVKFVDPVVTLY